jgi:hypothetical protein
VLPEVEPSRREEDEGGEGVEQEEVAEIPGAGKRKDGKGVEKLTAKKRQRVLYVLYVLYSPFLALVSSY